MRKLKTRILVTLVLVITATLGSASKAEEVLLANPETVPVYQPKFYPFEAGEKAVYRASWNGMVSVATAEVQTMPTVVEGRKAYQVRVEARTSRLLDWIWRMRGTITSTFDAVALTPSHYLFRQRENSRVIDTEAILNNRTDRWAVNRQQKGRKPRVFEFDSENTFDPISAVFLARSIDFDVGDRLYFKVFGGRHRYLLELTVDGKEAVELDSGKKVNAFRIVPRIQNLTKTGYAGRINQATIWISDDERRLPIKLSSKIFVGTVHMELVQDKHGFHSTSADLESPKL